MEEINTMNKLTKLNAIPSNNEKKQISFKLDSELKPMRSYETNANDDGKMEEAKIKTYNPKKKGEKIINENKKKKIENSIENDFNLDKIGLIKYAELHRSASRPMRKLNEFNNKTKFCPCCSLPAKQKGIIEPFDTCDSHDKFAECGQGTALYFSFIKFSIYMIIISCFIFCFSAYSTYNYFHQIKKICENYYNYIDNNNEINDICSFYVSSEDSNKSTLKMNFVLQFNIITVKDYKNLYNLINSVKTEKFNKSIINCSLLSFIGLVTLFLINLLYIILQSNEDYKADIDIVSPSDYSIHLSNLENCFSYFKKKNKKYEELNSFENNEDIIESSRDSTNQEKLYKLRRELGIPEEEKNEELTLLKKFRYFIENRVCLGAEDQKFDIKQINICFKLDELMKYEEELQQKKAIIDKVLNHPEQIKKNKDLPPDQKKYFKKCLFCYKEIELSKLNEEKNKLEEKIKELFDKTQSMTEDNFAGSVFVTFNSIKEQEVFMKQYPKNNIINVINFFKRILIKCFNKNSSDFAWIKSNINCEIPPEPEDILFENLQYTSTERLIRTISGFLFCLIFIGVDYGITYLLNMLQKKIDEKNWSFIIGYLISLIFSGVSSLINFLFGILLDITSKFEKHVTMTEYYLSYSAKLCIFTFLISAVVPLITELQSESQNHKVLLSNMLMMFLVNSILTPFLWTFNIFYFYKRIKISIIKRRNDAGNKHYKTQRELNKLYELPNMNISYKYSYIGRTLLMTFLYIPIFPIGILISAIGFIFAYFLEKYNFAKRYKRPEMLTSKICQFYVNYFVLNFFVYGIGDYIFMRDLYDTKIWSLLNIIIFGILIIVPYNQIFSCFCIGFNESEINKKKFDEVYFQFYNDYERTNPFTKKEGIKHYLKKLVKKGEIDEDQYRELIENMDKVNLLELYYEDKKPEVKTQRALTRKTIKTNNKSIYSSIKIRPYDIPNLINAENDKNIEVKDDKITNNIVELYNKKTFKAHLGISIRSLISSFNNVDNEKDEKVGIDLKSNKYSKRSNGVVSVEDLISEE